MAIQRRRKSIPPENALEVLPGLLLEATPTSHLWDFFSDVQPWISSNDLPRTLQVLLLKFFPKNSSRISFVVLPVISSRNFIHRSPSGIPQQGHFFKAGPGKSPQRLSWNFFKKSSEKFCGCSYWSSIFLVVLVWFLSKILWKFSRSSIRNSFENVSPCLSIPFYRSSFRKYFQSFSRNLFRSFYEWLSRN